MSNGSKPHIHRYSSIEDIRLLRAAESGNLGVLNDALLNGANRNVQNEQGRTPLHKAAFEGFVDIVERLIAIDADLNAKDKQGVTPHMLARACGYNAISIALQNAGATVVEGRNVAENDPVAMNDVLHQSDWVFRLHARTERGAHEIY